MSSCGTTKIIQVGSGSGANLTYTASPIQGVVLSDSGTDAIIPLADLINAGLMSPAQVAALSATTLTNAQIGVGNTYIQVVDPITGAINFVVDGVVEMSITPGKITIPNLLDPKAYIGSPQTIVQRDALTATTGMLVWVVDGAIKEWQYYDGTIWKSISESIEFATSAEVTAGLITDKIVAPDTLKVELDKKVDKPIASTQGFVATVDATGNDVEYIAAAPTAIASTQIEVTAGTAVTNKYVQPDTLKVELDKKLDNTQLIDDDTFATATATNIASAESTKAYVDGKTVIVDNLTSVSTTSSLSANQGKNLEDTKVNKPTLLADAGKTLVVNATGTDVEYVVVSGGEVNVVTESQTKTAHSFVVGDVIYNDGTTWLKASAALGTSIAQAVVSQVIDVNTFKVVYSGILTATSHGKTVGQYYYLDQTTAGATTSTHPTTGIVQQIYFVKDANTLLIDISNAFTAAATVPDVPLTYGRVRANLDLASTTHINTDPGTKIPFTVATYLSGMTDNAGSLIPSISGRYRADWLCMAASTDFLADGIFHVVQNGVSVGQTSYNMNEASAVNQSAGFIDVDLVAGLEVSLNYRTRHTASDGISWDRGSYFQLTQLPTAVAPIVDVVAEYGEQVLTPTTIGAATVDITGGSFTLPSSGTWEVEYFGNISLNAGNIVGGLLIADISNVEVANSRSVTGAGGSGGGNESAMVSNKVHIVTSAPTIYKIRGIGNAVNVSLSAGLAMGGAGNKVTWRKIAGGLPSTGQTVDLLYARQTTTQGTPTVGTIINLEQTVSGNIPFVNNTVTLSAGKTYKLEGSGAIMAGGSSTYGTRFYNVTTSQFIGDSSFAFSPNNANTPTLVGRNAMVEITPSVATQVQLRVDFLSGSGGIIGGSNLVNAGVGAGSNFDPNGASWMRVTQLGSTNLLTTNWQINATNGYTDISGTDVRMQWGTLLHVPSTGSITFPAPFANTNYTVVVSSAAPTNIFVTTGTKATTNFSCTTLTNAGSPSSNNPISYYAIGQKP